MDSTNRQDTSIGAQALDSYVPGDYDPPEDGP
jgi:hypothetical protein